MKTFTNNPSGFTKMMHDKITDKGNAEKWAKENGYPKYNRVRK